MNEHTTNHHHPHGKYCLHRSTLSPLPSWQSKTASSSQFPCRTIWRTSRFLKTRQSAADRNPIHRITRLFIHTYIHTYIHIVHKCMHHLYTYITPASINKSIHTYIHSLGFSKTSLHVYIHTYSTYIHICMNALARIFLIYFCSCYLSMRRCEV